jgi:hypothetical protein
MPKLFDFSFRPPAELHVFLFGHGFLARGDGGNLSFFSKTDAFPWRNKLGNTWTTGAAFDIIATTADVALASALALCHGTANLLSSSRLLVLPLLRFVVNWHVLPLLRFVVNWHHLRNIVLTIKNWGRTTSAMAF